MTMQPMLIHYCHCTYNTPVTYSPSVFSQNISCTHCGAISTGINVRGKAEEQANMQQDELAQLFSANMSLSQQPAQQAQLVVQQQQEQDRAPQQIIYASQHYTHSYHVAPSRSASEPALKTHIDSSDLATVLLRNSIDPTLLFPSQIDLFRNADNDQRLRLLELWRISPPSGRQGHPTGTDYAMSRQLYDWPPTSLAQEEAMAKLRYEKQQQQQEEVAQQEAIRQHQQQLEQSMAAEPYMASGYELMARREYEDSALKETNKYNQATDPVYNNTGGNGLWQKNVGSVADMENNYGAYVHAREYGLQAGYGDDEMVM
ncbi:hypothetical protein EJ02DRAFT_369417 [Clathrospora elynae]|uniref:Uncharacterized protein n=1 Tax=Clathrospora elynae TaxID=706981 RepID=A0A6A5SZX7_9PLEO|nr:hypothetical protein EJ02DRAFT_369417 [Clathrospora elynae]